MKGEQGGGREGGGRRGEGEGERKGERDCMETHSRKGGEL